MTQRGRATVAPRRRVHVRLTHRRWHGPVLLDDVARRLVMAGIPDRAAAVVLLAMLPTHVAEVGGRRLLASAGSVLAARTAAPSERRDDEWILDPRQAPVTQPAAQ